MAGTKQGKPAKPQRPRELQDPLNYYLYHPLAWQLARGLAHTPVTPNMVSVFGGLMVVAAGIVYANLAWPVGAALGMALHMGWHVVDGADGDLARMTGRSSPIGEMVDGVCRAFEEGEDAAGGDNGQVTAAFILDAFDQALDEADVAPEDARLHGGDGVGADHAVAFRPLDGDAG
jgi:hypothetical protein